MLIASFDVFIALYFSGVLFTHDGERFYLEYGTLRFSWDTALEWFFTLEEHHNDGDHDSAAVYKGLCGDFNGEASGESGR